MTFLSFLLGVTFWTFLEYIIHRFAGHEHKGSNPFKSEHLAHHRKVHYFAPAFKKVAAAIAITTVLLIILNLFFPFHISIAFLLGFMGMYGVYEIAHSRFHTSEPINKCFMALRKHHFYHHFRNPKMNFGVTTTFWDKIFGTYYAVETVSVPRKMCMDWLLIGNEIKTEYAQHFSLR